jgi:hypothetical protein
VAINNVFFTLSPALRDLPKSSGTLIHGWIERLDLLLQTLLSDFRISPVLDPGSVGLKNGTFFCPPLARSVLSSRPSFFTQAHALLIASGSGLGISRRTAEIVADCPNVARVTVLGIEGESQGKVTYAGRRREIAPFIADCDFIVTNSGFSTLSEALLARRPLVMLPIPGHFEQERNARFIASLRLGVVTREDRLQEDISCLREKFKGSHEHKRPAEVAATGSELAANYLCSLFHLKTI